MSEATQAAQVENTKTEEKAKQQRAPWGHAIGKDSGRISQTVWEMEAGTVSDLVEKCPDLDTKQAKASRIKSHLKHLRDERNAILCDGNVFSVISLNKEANAKARERASGQNVEYSESAAKKAESKFNSIASQVPNTKEEKQDDSK